MAIVRAFERPMLCKHRSPGVRQLVKAAMWLLYRLTLTYECRVNDSAKPLEGQKGDPAVTEICVLGIVCHTDKY